MFIQFGIYDKQINKIFHINKNSVAGRYYEYPPALPTALFLQYKNRAKVIDIG